MLLCGCTNLKHIREKEENVSTTSPPVATTGMLIRKPVGVVFRAFIDPAITTHFWFTESTGPLAPNASVTWTWGMYGAAGDVVVRDFEPDCRVRFEWGGETPNQVEWTFTPLADNRTFVDIRNWDFAGSNEEQTAAAIDATGGFSLVLAGAKAWLEHNLELNLVRDRFPKDLGPHGDEHRGNQ